MAEGSRGTVQPLPESSRPPDTATSDDHSQRIQSLRFTEAQSRTSQNPRPRHAETQLSTASSTIGPEWTPQCILSFDGGGIRGYSSLIILQRLMTIVGEIETEENPHVDSSFYPGEYRPCTNRLIPNGPPVVDPSNPCRFLPCHYFDYIGGTSTGGLISVMLGRLRMGVDECLSEYETLAGEVFGHPRIFSYRGPIFALRNKYDANVMQRVVENVVVRRLTDAQLDLGGDNFSSPSRLCKTVCVAYGQKPMFPTHVTNGGPYLFRSYDHWVSHFLDQRGNAANTSTQRTHVPDPTQLNPGAAHRIPIGEVARATTAAPTYFDNVIIQNRKFGDGGFGTNNPAYVLMVEVGQMNGYDNTAIELLVSIGTGQSEVSRFATGLFKELYTILRATKKLATDSETVHNIMTAQRTMHDLPYHRFNVTKGLSEMKMDEWKPPGGIKRRKTNKTLKKIREATDAYLENNDVMEDLRRVARVLVQRRRQRANSPLWNMVSTGLQYRCTFKKCPKAMKLRQCDENLKKHLMVKHNLGSETADEVAMLQRWVTAGEIPY